MKALDRSSCSNMANRPGPLAATKWCSAPEPARSGCCCHHRGRHRRRAVSPSTRSRSSSSAGVSGRPTPGTGWASSAPGRSLGHALLVRVSPADSAPRHRHRDLSISELRRTAAAASLFITELLAAIPSIVYGLWGVFVLVPLVREFQVATPEWLRGVPLFSGSAARRRLLSAALILAIMVIPFTSRGARVLRAVPQAQREGAYDPRRDALGSHQDGAVLRAHRHHRGRHARVRAGLGETMAVTMLIGNNPQISRR